MIEGVTQVVSCSGEVAEFEFDVAEVHGDVVGLAVLPDLEEDLARAGGVAGVDGRRCLVIQIRDGFVAELSGFFSHRVLADEEQSEDEHDHGSRARAVHGQSWP